MLIQTATHACMHDCTQPGIRVCSHNCGGKRFSASPRYSHILTHSIFFPLAALHALQFPGGVAASTSGHDRCKEQQQQGGTATAAERSDLSPAGAVDDPPSSSGNGRMPPQQQQQQAGQDKHSGKPGAKAKGTAAAGKAAKLQQPAGKQDAKASAAAQSKAGAAGAAGAVAAGAAGAAAGAGRPGSAIKPLAAAVGVAPAATAAAAGAGGTGAAAGRQRQSAPAGVAAATEELFPEDGFEEDDADG
jgi:hypothetical protein